MGRARARGGLRSDGLLEREAELECIAHAVIRAVEGEPALVVVEGAAGLGKTTLLSEARRRLDKGHTRCWSAARRAGGWLRLRGPAAAVAEPLLADLAPEDVTRCSSARRRGLAALEEPEGEAPPFDVSFGLSTLSTSSGRSFRARPVASLHDDAHWADSPSLRFLGSRCDGWKGCASQSWCRCDRASPGRQTLLGCDKARATGGGCDAAAVRATGGGAHRCEGSCPVRRTPVFARLPPGLRGNPFTCAS